MAYDLQRFKDAQNAGNAYKNALKEIGNGLKEGHWMWYIFPQLRGLGRSEIASYYGIIGKGEAKAYLADKGADLQKRQLPLICFSAGSFDELPAPDNSKDGRRKKGQKGHWRLQAGVRLNGLYMVDIDHIDNPRTLYKSWADRVEELGIVLVHETSSKKGLRIVAIADIARGNLADNQAWLARELGFKLDESCKDASRGSFCPGLEDILYINKEKLFTYENKAYDEKYGPLYRGGNSKPVAFRGNGSVKPAGASCKEGAVVPAVGSGGSEGGAAADDGLAKRIEEGYNGKTWQTIIGEWYEQNYGGLPGVGNRHHSLLKLACDLRYITESDPQVLARILRECEVGRDIERERGGDEIERIASDACAKPMYQTVPKRLQSVCRAVGVQLARGEADTAARPAATIDYTAWWHRLAPLLSESPGYREAVAQLPDEHKLGGVLAAGAMMGTYLTRCWWEHFDGKDYRLSFLVYVIGGAASGKSFVVDLDRLLMAPMQAADKAGRDWERQYALEEKRRAMSTSAARAKAPEVERPVVRYCPSSTSNRIFYERLQNNVDNEATGPDGQPMHLHCYTMESELATALRAQTGSWAGKNDFELKAFHNEYAGVDFMNSREVNGIIQVNWNQVISGTPEAMGRKVKPSTVLDGLVTRLVLFPMPQNDFQMIERRRAYRDHEREALLRSIGLKLEQVKGELKCERLVDFCYDYERQLTEEARLEQDYCLDYFRKRIPVIMMRYTLVRMVLREMGGLPPSPSEGEGSKKLELSVTDSDLEFARLIGDWCLMAQMHMYGQMVMEAQEREQSAFVPRKRSMKIREAYARLPETITTEILVSEGVAANMQCASMTLRRWLDDGLVEKADNKSYRKKYKEIPM